MREVIKVKLYREDWGNCQQLYKRIDDGEGKQWFARTEDGTWYTVSDAPNGYCERDCCVKSDIVFEVYGEDGVLYYNESNGINSLPFPFIKTTCKKEWESISYNFPNVQRKGYKKWICSFMDQNKYPEYGQNMSITVLDDNWSDFYYDRIAKETIHIFNYLGKPYEIVRLKCKHQICNEEWFEYFVGEVGSEFSEYYAGWEIKD